MTVSRVVGEGLRDRVFYDVSGGGVTFSGGEPLRQADFVIACLEQFRERGVHTAVDTCGLVERRVLLDAARFTDLFLYDVKHMDAAVHRAWAGTSNETILANLDALSRVHEAIWVRIPVIPGVNDDRRNLTQTAAFAASLRGVERVSLLPYHRLGGEKRARIGDHDDPLSIEEPGPDRMREAAAVFEAAGLQTTIGG